MPKITVSYRRDDSEAITGRIFDRLVAHYGKSAVFRDIDNIPAGVDFRKHIDEALQETDALIVVIGRRWMGSAKPGNSRIQDEIDPVRIEVESALKRGVAVIPVLVGGARMPTAAQLPASLEELAFRNAVRVDTGQDFDHHADRLLRAMDRTLGYARADVPAADAVRELASVEPAAPLLEPEVAASASSEKARPEWGGYAKSSVAHMIGSYLVLRSAFKTPGNLVTYATDMFWDDAEGGLIFQERDRLDARHSASRPCAAAQHVDVHVPGFRRERMAALGDAVGARRVERVPRHIDHAAQHRRHDVRPGFDAGRISQAREFRSGQVR